MTSKEAVSNYLLSSSKRLQLPNPFFPIHSQTKLKVLVAQLGIDGLGAPQPSPLHRRAMRFMNASENQKYFKKTFIFKHCLVSNIALKTQEIALPML